jgi:DNA-binding transcriptional regulator YhcF (GntR family)
MAAAGTLAPGAQLPTIRQLAADLGIAKGTVSKAYDELLRNGVVKSDGRRGTHVAEQPAADLSRHAAKEQLQMAAETYAITARQLQLSDQDCHVALDRALKRLPKR